MKHLNPISPQEEINIDWHFFGGDGCGSGDGVSSCSISVLLCSHYYFLYLHLICFSSLPPLLLLFSILYLPSYNLIIKNFSFNDF
jgi:hypothetical protein